MWLKSDSLWEGTFTESKGLCNHNPSLLIKIESHQTMPLGFLPPPPHPTFWNSIKWIRALVYLHSHGLLTHMTVYFLLILLRTKFPSYFAHFGTFISELWIRCEEPRNTWWRYWSSTASNMQSPRGFVQSLPFEHRNATLSKLLFGREK